MNQLRYFLFLMLFSFSCVVVAHAQNGDTNSQYKNDGSVEDLYKYRQQNAEAVKKIQEVIPSTQGVLGFLSGGEKAGSQGVANARCKEIERFTENPFLSAGLSAIVTSPLHLWFFLAEILFFFLFSIWKAARRPRAGSELSRFDFVREIRLGLIGIFIAAFVLPLLFFQKAALQVLGGIVQVLLGA